MYRQTTNEGIDIEGENWIHSSFVIAHVAWCGHVTGWANQDVAGHMVIFHLCGLVQSKVA